MTLSAFCRLVDDIPEGDDLGLSARIDEEWGSYVVETAGYLFARATSSGSPIKNSDSTRGKEDVIELGLGFSRTGTEALNSPIVNEGLCLRRLNGFLSQFHRLEVLKLWSEPPIVKVMSTFMVCIHHLFVSPALLRGRSHRMNYLRSAPRTSRV